MSDKVVEVPGVGNVSFPGNMSDDEISAAIQKQMRPAAKNAAIPEQTRAAEHNFAGIKYQYDPNEPIATDAVGYGKQIGKTLAETGLGVGKAGIGTLYHIGRMIGVVPKDQDFENALKDENTAQTVGHVAENVAEFAGGEGLANAGLKAAGVAGKLATAPKAVQVAARLAKGAAVGGGVTAAEGGSAKVGAAVGAGGEAVGATAEALAPSIKKAATTAYLRFLNPTKQANKIKALDVVDEALARGIHGSLGDVAETAAEGKNAANQALDDVYKQHGSTKVTTSDITDALEEAKQAHVVSPTSNSGKLVPMSQQDKQAVKMIDGLKQVVDDASTNGLIDVDRLRKIRGAWYKVANGTQQTGYSGGVKTLEQTVHANAAENLRDIINSNLPPEAMIEQVNHEYTFWKKFEKVANDTLIRKAGQGVSMGEQLVGAGVAAGRIAAGDIPGAILEKKGAELLVKAARSGAFTSTTAVWKAKFADALAKGQKMLVTSMLNNLVRAGASQATQD